MKMKKYLFIVDPLYSLNVDTDTTLAIIQEASHRGIKTFACEIKDIFLKDGSVYFMSAPIYLHQDYKSPPVYLEKPAPYAADEFNAIFMRKDPPIDESFLAALFMLRCCDHKKISLINSVDGILLANEKLFGQKVAANFFPPTLVSANKSLLKNFIIEQKKVALKPLFKAGGAGVLVFESIDRNIISALELLTKSFSVPIMAQAYIQNARLGDKRILILGGTAIGAVTRIPAEYDHRANFHAGGFAQKTYLTDKDEEIVKFLSSHLMELKLHFVGIDIIDGYLTEINVTSPTGLIEIEKLLKNSTDKKSLRAKICDYVEELIA
jgi:glutathione synthase